MTIHPTAIIDPNATIESNVQIGAYAVIGAKVELADNCIIDPHVVIHGPTRIGSGCHIHSHSVIGDSPQTTRSAADSQALIIGAGSIIREFVTLNRGEEKATVIGDNCLIMAYSHVAHDCQLGDRCVLANGAQLAGHVQVEDGVTFGGMCGVHQFVRIGRLAMIAGGSMVTQDVPPFALVQGDRAQIRGINRIGLRRNHISSEHINTINQSFKHLFLRADAPDDTQFLAQLMAFNLNSRRGLCGYHQHAFQVP